MGNDQVFDAQEPTFRLTMRGRRLSLLIHGRRLEQERSTPPVFHLFLFLAVYACAVHKTNEVTLAQIEDVTLALRRKLGGELDQHPWPTLIGPDRRANMKQLQALRGWAKDCKTVAELVPFFGKARRNSKHSCFMSVEGKSSGRQGILIPGLIFEEVDIDPKISVSFTHITQGRPNFGGSQA